MTKPTEAEVEAAKQAVCMAHRSGLLCQPDAMKACRTCAAWARGALTAAAQVRERAASVRSMTAEESELVARALIAGTEA